MGGALEICTHIFLISRPIPDASLSFLLGLQKCLDPAVAPSPCTVLGETFFDERSTALQSHLEFSPTTARQCAWKRPLVSVTRESKQDARHLRVIKSLEPAGL